MYRFLGSLPRLRTFCILCAAIVLAAITPNAALGQVPHTVEPGESLWSIAAVNGLTVDELAAANGLSPDTQLVAGTTVSIPPASAAAPVSPGGASTSSGSGQCTWECSSTAHPHPTDEVVSPADVGSVAGEYGMSAPLAQSIAWNESAFDNSAVSSAGARGVMQIMPDTWNFIDQQLTDQPLDPASASDNVRAGVLYLHHLYHQMGGDGDATVASYYQGPNRETLLPETQTYVNEIRDDQAEFAGGG